MGQASLFSVQARSAQVSDVAGVLCAHGQIVAFGQGNAARLSVVVDEAWRAAELAAACGACGITGERGATDEGHPVMRTAFLACLAPMAASWTKGAVKAVPPALQLDGPMLRLWAVTAGRCDGRGYVLGLDPHAPGTYEPLATAMARIGLSAAVLVRGGPALRVTGGRRLARFAELVGEPPANAPIGTWPV